MTKILVVDDEANVQRLLQYTLKQAGYTVSVAGDGVEALKLWASEQPGLILLDVSLPKLDGYGVAERIRADEGGKSHVPIIMLTSEKEVEQKVRGLRAGADDYLVKPFHQAELLARMRGLLSRFTVGDGASRARPPLGKMIAFYGAKGGVGATTISINTAIALHNQLDRKVALVDAVLQFGDHRVFLDLGNDRKSVTDLMTAPQLDAELLKSVVVKHDSGVDLLLAPTSPEEADLVNPENFAAILAMLRTMYDYVIVDVDKRLGDLALSILDHADEVHIVMTADLSCLKNVRLVLETMDHLGYEKGKVKLVLNRSNAYTGINVNNAESALNRKVDHQVINEYRGAISALNSGEPFMSSRPDTPLGRSVSEFAHQLDAAFIAEAAPVRS
jgi:pilus assembly protein CpaE